MSTSKELFKRFINLCQKWPKDETKYGRDYAEFFRQQLSQHFPHGELSQVKEPERIAASLDSLEKIANNIYFKENPLKRSSASGMESWACKEAVSTDSLRQIHEQEETTLIKKLRQVLNVQISGTELEKSKKKSEEVEKK